MNGILLIDKEPDWTSNDVVAKLKGILHERRIGHSGTLDPMATGLLVVFVGRATRAVEFAEGHDKRYLAALRLGVSTDTQDTTGNVLRERPVNVSESELRSVLSRFTGEIMQIPPMYSAVKVNGKRLYEIARRGEEIERAARRVTIYGIDLVGRSGEDYLLDVRCSKGTYIRTLCNDIGEALQCGGCMSSLRRTDAGGFSVDKAVTIGEVQRLADEGRAEELLIPTDSMFSDLPVLTVRPAQEKKIRCGSALKAAAADGRYRVYSEQGEFLMLGEAENGMIKTIKSFFEVN